MSGSTESINTIEGAEVDQKSPAENATDNTAAEKTRAGKTENSASNTTDDTKGENGSTENGGGESVEPEAKKRKLEDPVNGVKEENSKGERGKENGMEERGKENGMEEGGKENDNENTKEKAPEWNLWENASTEKKSVAEKCPECDYKCYTDAEMRVHRTTSHGSAPRRMRLCSNCNYTCQNTWEMDYHARSRGHKAKEVMTCKKCDFLCETKEESWTHKKVHIAPNTLFECGDCSWCSERLDNMRYHAHTQDHKTKIDYEAIAMAKAEAKGPKDLKQYHTKLAKDIKKALVQKRT